MIYYFPLLDKDHLEDILYSLTAHKIFLICRFPSAINTSHYHDDLKVVSEDEMGILQSALAGTQSISVVLFQVQKHFQKMYWNFTKMLISSRTFVSSTSASLMPRVSIWLLQCALRSVGTCLAYIAFPSTKILSTHRMVRRKRLPRALILLFFIPPLQLEVLRSYPPALNTLKHGYATAQSSPQKFMKKSSQFLKSFGFVYIQMLSQSKQHLGLLTEVAYRSAFRRQRLIAVLVV